MRFSVIGLGVAGSWLARMLHLQGHEVTVYEQAKKENHLAVCAWGSSRNVLDDFCLSAGLNFDKYILHEGKKVIVVLPNGRTETMRARGLVSYNKLKLEHDLVEGLNVVYGKRYTRADAEKDDADFVLDCTGMSRTLLPKVEKEWLVPAYEYLVEINPNWRGKWTLPVTGSENVASTLDAIWGHDDFIVMLYKQAQGYLWYFPLQEGVAWIGAGDTRKRYEGLDMIMKSGIVQRTIMKIGRPIRMTPPSKMLPFYGGKIVGVGESIGCVFPLLGEGIIPSLQCAQIFLEELNRGNGNWMETYARKVLKHFDWYERAYTIVRTLEEGKMNFLNPMVLANLAAFFSHMRKEQDRFGFEVNAEQWISILKASR